MGVHLAIILLASLPTDPLSGFEANFHKARVSVRYSFEMTTASPDAVHRLWRGEDPLLDGTYLREIVGEWAFDGTSEFDEVHAFGPPVGSISRVTGAGPWDSVNSEFAQTIFDASLWAHLGDSGPLQVARSVTSNPANPALRGFGPFRWSPSDLELDRFLRATFPEAHPERLKGVHQGRVLDVEVYHKKEEVPTNLVCDMSLRCEVHYDPDSGYLPRLVRCTSLTLTETDVQVVEKQMHLVQCQMGPDGGFVPAEYYVVQFQFCDPKSKHPGSSIETAFEPSGPVSVGHFQTLSLQSQQKPVAMKRPDRYRWDPHSGHDFKNPSDNDFPLTMSRIDALVGDALDPREPVSERPPSLIDRLFGASADEAEPKPFVARPRPEWPLYILIVPIVVSAAVALARRLRGRNDVG